MKLIIDIDEEDYNDIITCNPEVETGYVLDLLMKCVENGTPIPDNATNGEIMQMMFPNGVMLNKDECVGFEIMLDDKHSYCSFFDYIWWNAPYQKGGKE